MTKLIPLEVNTTVGKYTMGNSVSSPGMSMVEWQFGEVSNAFVRLGQIAVKDLDLSLSANRGYAALHSKKDVINVQALLMKIQERVLTKDYLHQDLDAGTLLWISLSPLCIVYRYTEKGRTTSDWLLKYSQGKTLTTNSEIKNNDTYQCLLPDGIGKVVVAKVDSLKQTLTVKRKYSTGPFFKVPVWCCFKE